MEFVPPRFKKNRDAGTLRYLCRSIQQQCFKGRIILITGPLLIQYLHHLVFCPEFACGKASDRSLLR